MWSCFRTRFWSNAIEGRKSRWPFLAVIEFLLRRREGALLDVHVYVLQLCSRATLPLIPLHVVVQILLKGLLERHGRRWSKDVFGTIGNDGFDEFRGLR